MCVRASGKHMIVERVYVRRWLGRWPTGELRVMLVRRMPYETMEMMDRWSFEDARVFNYVACSPINLQLGVAVAYRALTQARFFC